MNKGAYSMATFADITNDIIQNKQTGLLSLVAKNGKYHVKIFFAKGEVYHVAYGDLKDAACLDACETLEWSECFFTGGAKITTNEHCSMPTSTIIEHLKKCTDKSGGLRSTEKDGGTQNLSVSVIRNRLKVALVRQVGPVGEILFSRIVEQWRPSSPPAKQQLIELVDRIKEIIEDDSSKKEFEKEAGTIIF
jgi:hypothetical protein